VTDAYRLRALGWEPLVMVEEGLHRYAAWIQQYATVEEYFTEAEKLLKSTQVVMKSRN
jgi:hypothetical protein